MSRREASPCRVVAVLILISLAAGCGGRGASSAASSGGCSLVDSPGASRRTQSAPPAPDVSVRAVGAETVRFDWRFRRLPARCRPASLALTVLPAESRSTPWTDFVAVRGVTGRHLLRLSTNYPRSNEALASAFTRDGRRSPVVRAAIRRH